MNDYNNGEIWGWNGGECPVHPESEVMVWYRNNTPSAGLPAKLHSWRHKKCYYGDGDIVCFQVTKPYVEPKVIWVNEYADGYVCAYTSKQMAESWVHCKHTRIAVEYVEKPR
jgi:hypothetical protein